MLSEEWEDIRYDGWAKRDGRRIRPGRMKHGSTAEPIGTLSGSAEVPKTVKQDAHNHKASVSGAEAAAGTGVGKTAAGPMNGERKEGKNLCGP